MKDRPSPCYKCETRQLGCHSTCEAYMEFKRKMDAVRGERVTENEIRSGIIVSKLRNRYRGG